MPLYPYVLLPSWLTHSYLIIFKTHTLSLSVLVSDSQLSKAIKAQVWNHGMFPLVIYRILCVACWLYAELQLCCAIDKLKEERTARMIKCSKTCAHLAKNLVGTQLSYEVRNTIRDHFSFTWMSCKFTIQTSFHCAFIMLLYYITLIEKQSSGLHITASSSLWKASETLLLIAGRLLYNYIIYIISSVH